MSQGDDIPWPDHTLAVNTCACTSKAWLVAKAARIWFGSQVRQLNSFKACLSGEVGANPTLTRNRKSALALKSDYLNRLVNKDKHPPRFAGRSHKESIISTFIATTPVRLLF
jgi:hypothetical protein